MYKQAIINVDVTIFPISQLPDLAHGCHYSMIYFGNQTLAYPFGWRSDRWLLNVVDQQYGGHLHDRQPLGCPMGPEGNACRKSNDINAKPYINTPPINNDYGGRELGIQKDYEYLAPRPLPTNEVIQYFYK